MNKYTIMVTHTYWGTRTVEAESEEEAIDKLGSEVDDDWDYDMDADWDFTIMQVAVPMKKEIEQ